MGGGGGELPAKEDIGESYIVLHPNYSGESNKKSNKWTIKRIQMWYKDDLGASRKLKLNGNRAFRILAWHTQKVA